VTDSTCVSFTVNEACPLAFVVPLTVVTVELPLPAARVTALPLTGEPPPLSRVTVIVAVELPSATTDVGLAATVELAALTGERTDVAAAAPVSVRAVPPPPEFWSSKVVQVSPAPAVVPVAFRMTVMVPASPALRTALPVCAVYVTTCPEPG